MTAILEKILAKSADRFLFWIGFVNYFQCRQVAEIGVHEGVFSEKLLLECESIRKYYMIDPWRKLDDWNKPLNVSNRHFEEAYNKMLHKTSFAKDKINVLRGKTSEVINEIDDGFLDFAYIDGDHTLKGIAIDLIAVFPKVKAGAFIGGDDFSENIWQHPSPYEPTLVFPYAIYFAEAVDCPIYALPNNQFLVCKKKGFNFYNISGKHYKMGLLHQFEKLHEKNSTSK